MTNKPQNLNIKKLNKLPLQLTKANKAMEKQRNFSNKKLISHLEEFLDLTLVSYLKTSDKYTALRQGFSIQYWDYFLFPLKSFLEYLGEQGYRPNSIRKIATQLREIGSINSKLSNPKHKQYIRFWKIHTSLLRPID